MKRNWLILLALILLIIVPPALTGYNHLKKAESATPESSRYYELAAKILFWRPELYEKAGLAAAESDPQRAIGLLRLARQKGRLSPAGRAALGEAYFASGAEANAISEWESLLNEGQETGRIGPRLASWYHTQGRYNDEEQVLRQWLTIDPTNVEANEGMGLLLAASASPEAFTRLELASAASPEAARRLEGLLTALGSPDSPPAYQLTLAGQALANLNEWILALSAFERATLADETYAPAWAWLGLARQQTGQADAQPAIERALALDTASAPIRGMAGIYWQTERNYPRAEEHYLAATQMEPGNPAWWLALAAMISQRDIPAALETYLHATQLAPTDANTWYTLAAFCVENGVYIQDRGLDAALRAYALAPDNPQYMDMLGRLLAADGETDTAEEMYKKAGAADPQNAAPRFHLALLYLQTNRPAQAKNSLQEVNALDPGGQYGAQAQKLLERYFP